MSQLLQHFPSTFLERGGSEEVRHLEYWTANRKGFHIAFAAELNNGGASGLLYEYLFTWAGTVTQVLIIAELGSMCVQ